MTVRWQESDIDEVQLRPERPIGIAILTIIDGFYAGLLPVFGTIGLLMSPQTPDQDDVSLLFLCVTVAIPVAIMMASIGAFKGHDRARFGLLILLTVYFGLTAFQDVTLAAAGISAEDAVFTAMGRALRLGVWLAINLWYFLRPSTIAFFRRRTN